MEHLNISLIGVVKLTIRERERAMGMDAPCINLLPWPCTWPKEEVSQLHHMTGLQYLEAEYTKMLGLIRYFRIESLGGYHWHVYNIPTPLVIGLAHGEKVVLFPWCFSSTFEHAIKRPETLVPETHLIVEKYYPGQKSGGRRLPKDLCSVKLATPTRASWSLSLKFYDSEVDQLPYIKCYATKSIVCTHWQWVIIYCVRPW